MASGTYFLLPKVMPNGKQATSLVLIALPFIVAFCVQFLFLFMSQCFDRAKLCCLLGRIDTKEDADSR